MKNLFKSKLPEDQLKKLDEDILLYYVDKGALYIKETYWPELDKKYIIARANKKHKLKVAKYAMSNLNRRENGHFVSTPKKQYSPDEIQLLALHKPWR